MKKIILSSLICAFCTISFGQQLKFGKVSKEELAEQAHPLEPDADAAILYREVKTRFDYSQDDGFFMLTDVFERVKIYTKDGFEWANKSINLYQGSSGNDDSMSGLKGYTYSLNGQGKIEETKLKNNGIFDEEKDKFVRLKKFTMPNLTEGCIIEYKYTIKSHFISNIDTYKLQENIPTNEVYLRFKAPEYFNYKTHQRGWIPLNIETDRIEKTITYFPTDFQPSFGNTRTARKHRQLKYFESISTVSLKNVPAIKEEAHSGNVENYTSSINFELAYTQFPNSPLEMYTTDWDAVSQKIYLSPDFGLQLDKKGFFSSDVNELLQKANGDNEKMQLIFEFVKSKTTWNGYTGLYANKGVKECYKDGVGNSADINLLLTAMFRYARLKANPILVSTKSHGIPIFPTRNGFNYVIAGVEVENNVILFDATDKLSAPNTLPSHLLNWQGRMIREDGSSTWVPLVPSKPAREAYMASASLAEDGLVSGTIKSQYTGNNALAFRSEFGGLTTESVDTKIKSRYTDVDAFESVVENGKNPYKPLKLNYAFETSSQVEEIDGKLYFSPMLFLKLDENPFKQDDRKYPIDYGYPNNELYIINIDLPEGYLVESIPENAAVKVGDDIYHFKYIVSESNHKINLRVDFKVNASLIGPESYTDIKAFYQFIIDKEEEKVVLIKA